MKTLSVAALVTFLVTSGTATETFRFIAEDGQFLATLELTQFPATHDHVIGFTFTEAGADLFGYVEGLYQGSFDETGPDNFPQLIRSEIDGGLTGMSADFGIRSISVIDRDPPLSSALAPPYRQFGFSTEDAPLQDSIILANFADLPDISGPSRVRVHGHFVPIPEPDWGACALLLPVFFLLWRRCRCSESDFSNRAC